MKVCKFCKQEKELSEFAYSPVHADYKMHFCKDCTPEYNKRGKSRDVGESEDSPLIKMLREMTTANK